MPLDPGNPWNNQGFRPKTIWVITPKMKATWVPMVGPTNFIAKLQRSSSTRTGPRNLIHSRKIPRSRSGDFWTCEKSACLTGWEVLVFFGCSGVGCFVGSCWYFVFFKTETQ